MRVIIHFYPRKSRLNNDGQLPFYFRYTVKSKRVDLSTGLFIQPKHWSEAKGRVKDRAPNAYTVNERLDKLKTEIQDYYNQLRSSGEGFSVSTIKDYLLGGDNKTGILEVFDYYLESMLAKTGGYSKETYKHYKSSRKRLATFIKDHYKKNDHPVQTIKFGFLDAFGVAVISQVQNTVLKQDKTMFQLGKCFFHQFHISPNPSRNTSVTIHVYSSIISEYRPRRALLHIKICLSK